MVGVMMGEHDTLEVLDANAVRSEPLLQREQGRAPVRADVHERQRLVRDQPRVHRALPEGVRQHDPVDPAAAAIGSGARDPVDPCVTPLPVIRHRRRRRAVARARRDTPRPPQRRPARRSAGRRRSATRSRGRRAVADAHHEGHVVLDRRTRAPLVRKPPHDARELAVSLSSSPAAGSSSRSTEGDRDRADDRDEATPAERQLAGRASSRPRARTRAPRPRPPA